MIDMPTNYSQRYNRFFTECKDEYLSEGDIAEELLRYIGSPSYDIEEIDEVLLEPRELCNMERKNK